MRRLDHSLRELSAGLRAREFSALAGLLRGLPVYVLELGADVSALPDLITEAIAA